MNARDFLLAELVPRLAEECIDEQTAAHADAAMDAPHRELDARFLERLAPREHMLIHAVDERSVEVEEEGGLFAHVTRSDGVARSLATPSRSPTLPNENPISPCAPR